MLVVLSGLGCLSWAACLWVSCLPPPPCSISTTTITTTIIFFLLFRVQGPLSPFRPPPHPSLGNYLNGGTNRGGAYGFRLETLVKADSIKGADNKTTLVDVVANLALTAPGDAKAMQHLATVGSLHAFVLSVNFQGCVVA